MFYKVSHVIKSKKTILTIIATNNINKKIKTCKHKNIIFFNPQPGITKSLTSVIRLKFKNLKYWYVKNENTKYNTFSIMQIIIDCAESINTVDCVYFYS